MTQLLIWLAVLAAIAGAFFALIKENERQRSRTTEEFERDLAETKGMMPSLTRAGALEMEKLISGSKRAAIELRQDERGGRTRTGSKGDDEGRTEVPAEVPAEGHTDGQE